MTKGPLVLVVDDNEDNRDLAVHVLVHHGFRVETAADGDEAIRKAAALRPAVVVMDLAMPRMNGWQATAAIKSLPELSDICVIVVSAHGMDLEREMAQKVGCDMFIVKPFAPMMLVAAVRAATGPHAGKPAKKPRKAPQKPPPKRVRPARKRKV